MPAGDGGNLVQGVIHALGVELLLEKFLNYGFVIASSRFRIAETTVVQAASSPGPADTLAGESPTCSRARADFRSFRYSSSCVSKRPISSAFSSRSGARPRTHRN